LEQDINNLTAIVNSNKELNNYNSNMRANSEPNNEDYTEEKENNSNINNSLLSNNLKEKENKLSILKKNFDKYTEKFKELAKKREGLMNNFYKMGIKDFYFEYLQSIMKAHNAKLFIIENKFKEKFNNAINIMKENYISELENQVRLRDTILSKQNIRVEEEQKLKSIEQLKNEYSCKLPLILPVRGDNNSNNGLSNYHSTRNMLLNNNLPPINISNINSILSDVRNINNNISKIEKEAARKDQSRTKNKENQLNGIKDPNRVYQARNYSQNVRNALLHKDNNGNHHSNKQLLYNPSKKNLNSKLINPTKRLNKDSYSEKSVNSNNASNEQDSETIDIEHSGDESNIRKIRKNNFKIERKSAVNSNLYINKEESPNYHSPNYKKDFPKQNFLNKNNDFIHKNDVIPLLKKKDLNVFLNDKQRLRSQKKMPFKI
jgi:hypothetical protein